MWVLLQVLPEGFKELAAEEMAAKEAAEDARREAEQAEAEAARQEAEAEAQRQAEEDKLRAKQQKDLKDAEDELARHEAEKAEKAEAARQKAEAETARKAAQEAEDEARRQREAARPPEWVLGETEFNGGMRYVGDTKSATKPETQEIEGPVADGIATLRNDPDTYEAVYFQDDMPKWPKDQQSYSLVKRLAGCDTSVVSEPDGGFNWVQACDRVRVMLLWWSGRVVVEYVGASAGASRGLQSFGSRSTGGRRSSTQGGRGSSRICKCLPFLARDVTASTIGCLIVKLV